MSPEAEKKLIEVLTSIQGLIAKRETPPGGKEAGLLTMKQLAVRWEVSERKIQEMKSAEKIPFIMIEGSVRFPLREIEKYEARNTIMPSGKAS